jgi:hypothetical protein
VHLFGHRHADIAKRIDVAATAIFHGMATLAAADTPTGNSAIISAGEAGGIVAADTAL